MTPVRPFNTHGLHGHKRTKTQEVEKVWYESQYKDLLHSWTDVNIPIPDQPSQDMVRRHFHFIFGAFPFGKPAGVKAPGKLTAISNCLKLTINNEIQKQHFCKNTKPSFPSDEESNMHDGHNVISSRLMIMNHIFFTASEKWNGISAYLTCLKVYSFPRYKNIRKTIHRKYTKAISDRLSYLSGQLIVNHIYYPFWDQLYSLIKVKKD